MALVASRLQLAVLLNLKAHCVRKTILNGVRPFIIKFDLKILCKKKFSWYKIIKLLELKNLGEKKLHLIEIRFSQKLNEQIVVR